MDWPGAPMRMRWVGSRSSSSRARRGWMSSAADSTMQHERATAHVHPKRSATGGNSTPATRPPSGTADCLTENTRPRRAVGVTRASTWLAPGVARTFRPHS